MKTREFLKTIALIASITVVIVGVLINADESIVYWRGSVFRDFFGWALSCLLTALTLKRLNVSNRAFLLISALIMYLSVGVGWAQSIGIFYLCVSSYFAGRLLLYSLFKNERAKILFDESLIVGIGIYLCIFGVLVHFPVNYVELYITILAIPLLTAMVLKLPSRYAAEVFKAKKVQARQISTITYWKLALSIIVVGYTARFAFFPSVSFDDNAMHLRMWTVLTSRHIYDFDITSQIWAAAPFAVDLIHAIVSIVSQNDARGALNLALLAGLLRFIWKLSRFINHRIDDRLLIVTLFASTPILANLLTTLQTELFLAFLAAAGALFILQKSRVFSGSKTVATIMIAALCMAIKLPGAVLGIFILATYSIKLWYTKKRILCIPPNDSWGVATIGLIAGFVAFHSYGVAWYVAENPTFPLYNGYFKSPYFPPYNFVDNLYVTGATFQSYWGFFFNTGKHFESRNFVAGFQYLLLLPLGICLLLSFRRRRGALVLLWPLLGFGLVMFSVMQYWRYLFPVLPIASIMIGALLLYQSKSDCFSLSYYAAKTIIVLFAITNIFFLPGVSWYFGIPSQHAFSEFGKERILASIVPEQVLNALLNKQAPGAKVLYDHSRPFGASLATSPTYINWYAPTRQDRVMAWRSIEDVAAFLREESIQYVYWDTAIAADENDFYRPYLRKYLSRFGWPVFQVGSVVAYRVHEHEINLREVVHTAPARINDQFSREVSMKGSEDGAAFLASNELFKLQQFDTNNASIARYTISLECPFKGATFIAQINWDVLNPYYRFVNCNKDIIVFSESFPVPASATRGIVYLSTRGAGVVRVKNIRVELN